jgi:hypothetical protein
MAAGAIPSYGTLLQVDDGALNFTSIADIKNPGNPSMQANVVDVTVHNTGSPWREKRPTLLEFQPLTLEVNWLPTNATHSHAAGLGLLFRNRTSRSWRWVNNSDAGSDYHQFTGYVTQITETAPIDGVYSATVQVTPTAAPVWTVT